METYWSFSNTGLKNHILVWAMGLFTAAQSQADLHNLVENVRVQYTQARSTEWTRARGCDRSLYSH